MHLRYQFQTYLEKERKKYFTTIEDFRDRKIAHILNNKENDNKDDFIGY